MEKIIIDENQFFRTISRISHEVIEKHQDLDGIVIVGIKRRGAEIAELIQRKIKDLTGKNLPSIDLDIIVMIWNMRSRVSHRFIMVPLNLLVYRIKPLF